MAHLLPSWLHYVPYSSEACLHRKQVYNQSPNSNVLALFPKHLSPALSVTSGQPEEWPVWPSEAHEKRGGGWENAGTVLKKSLGCKGILECLLYLMACWDCPRESSRRKDTQALKIRQRPPSRPPALCRSLHCWLNPRPSSLQDSSLHS